MQWLAVGVAVSALGFSLSLFRSRKNPHGWGNVLVVMPLVASVPVVALMASGLDLITGFRAVSTGSGLTALAESISRAAHTQYIGHASSLALAAALALVLVVLFLRRQTPAQQPQPDPPGEAQDTSEAPADAPAEPKLSRRHATAVLSLATLVCIAAIVTLTKYEARFMAAPLSIITIYDAGDTDEFSTNRRGLEEHRRIASNTLVVETFRALVVVVLLFVLFDAFLTGSRGLAFTRWTLLVSAMLLLLTAFLSARSLYRQQELRQKINEALVSIESRAQAATEEDSESTEMPTGLEETPQQP